MDNPFISVRKYIKWGDEPRGEDTNTLVLTTRSKHYIDIRILHPTQDQPPLPNDPTDTDTISRLQWAFAGACSSTPAKLSPSGETVKPAHTIWTHWIDSNFPSAKEGEIRDEGDMYPQSDGTVLEYGRMINPKTGKMSKYEECWEDVETNLVGEEEEFVSWVLTSEDEEKGVKGMIIRVGEVIQGLVIREGKVGVVRWEWSEGDEGWEWQRTLAVGRVEVPGILFEEGAWVEEGEEVMGSDGLDWVCVEAFEWS